MARRVVLVLLVVSTGAIHAASPAPWPDTPLARLEALALIQTLNGQILAGASATLTLEQWCRAHQLAAQPNIVAQRVDGASQSPSPEQRRELGISAEEPVRYRRVELRCGDKLLSIADNWYVPARLSAAMNSQLDTTQTPFGIVVRPLHAHRETLEVRVLWSPLADGWEGNAAGAVPPARPAASLPIPEALLEHRAVLYTPEHQAIAEVHEIYQRDLLAFPEPNLRPSD